ncbi:MAG: ABC transporter substrate-binding protein [Dehalococcoidia bacterium]|nr:ABC transporter substrate-binding protein [Dehalococcoidia bacterium]
MKKLTILVVTLVALLSMVLASCTSAPTATPTQPAPTATQPAPTATRPPTAAATPVPGATATRVPTPTPTSPAPTATPPQPTPTGAPQLLKFGAHLALSGSGALWGLAGQRGNNIAKEEINAAGGIVVGGQRYLLDNVVYYDDKYIPDEGVKAANKLIFEDKVKFVVNTGGTGPSLASAPIFTDNKILSLQGLCYSKDSIGAKYPYAFRSVMSSAFYYKPFVDWMRKTKYPTESQKVALLDQNDALGWTVHEQALASWKKSGATVVFEGYYPAGTTDFTSILTTILAKGPTLFDPGAVSPGQFGPMITQLRDLNFKGPIITATYQIPTDLQKAVKADYLEGLITAYPDMITDAANPAQKAFSTTFIKAYGEPFLPLSTWSYVGLKNLAQAIVKANSLDPVVVTKTLEGMTFPGTILGDGSWAGAELYGGLNHEFTANQMFIQLQNGKVVRVADLKPQIYTAP